MGVGSGSTWIIINPRQRDFHVQNLFLWRRFRLRSLHFKGKVLRAALGLGEGARQDSCWAASSRAQQRGCSRLLVQHCWGQQPGGNSDPGQCGTGRGAAFGSTRSRRKGDAEFLQSEPSPWCSPWVPAGLCPHPSPTALLPWGSPGPPAPLPAAGTSSACKPCSGCKTTNPKSPNPSGSSADPRALLTRAQGTTAQEIWL